MTNLHIKATIDDEILVFLFENLNLSGAAFFRKQIKNIKVRNYNIKHWHRSYSKIQKEKVKFHETALSIIGYILQIQIIFILFKSS